MQEAAKVEADAEGLAKMERRKKRRCKEEATRAKRANVPQVVPPVEAAKVAAPTETTAAPTEAVTPDVPPTNNVDSHSRGIANVTWVQQGTSVQCA